MVNKDAIISVVSIISEHDVLCKKKLQKLVYLIQEKGIDLGCDYVLHFYGPYSADLDFVVRDLCAENVLSIDYTPSVHKISIKDDSVIIKPTDEDIDRVINEFGHDSPSELELLATALYVYNVRKDVNKVVAGVEKIKGNKYSKEQINSAIDRLRKTGYVSTSCSL